MQKVSLFSLTLLGWLISTALLPTTIHHNAVKLPSPAGLVFRSPDQGKTWLDISGGLPETLEVQNLASQNESVYVGTGNGGVYSSSTKSIEWQKIGGAPFMTSDNITGIFPLQDGLYASTLQNGFLQKYICNGVWVPARNALNGKTIRTVLMVQQAIFAIADGELFRTANSGKSWEPVYPAGQVMTIVESNGILLAGTYTGVVRSTDGGATWESVLEDGQVHKTMVVDGQFIVASQPPFRPFNARQDLAAARRLLRKTGVLRSSTDGGKTWKRIDLGLPDNKVIYDLEKVNGYLVCSNEAGIYRSADNGMHWELALETPDKKFTEMTVVKGVIYAVMSMTGC